MEWTWYRLLLAFVMLTSGSANVLFGKWADSTEAEGTPGYPPRKFNHPFFQAIAMFLGEMLCGLVFIIVLFYRKKQGHPVSAALGQMTFSFKEIFSQPGGLARSFFVFFPPAMCDVGGTSLMFIALNYTTAASYQMLRGAVIIFTALLSVIFLKRVINIQKWTGIFAVLVGLVVVGLADFLFNPSSTDINMVITGDELVILAQIIAACQMVFEERFLGKLDVNPLLAVGLEGLYGFTVLSLLSIPMYFIPVGPQFSGSPEYRLEDVLDAFAQMANSWQITVALIGMVLSISFFNWAGVSVTKELSATTRMVLDSCRTLIVWGVTLGLGWQVFQYLQVIGFVVLTIGIFIYNEILTVKLVKDTATCKYCKKSDEEALLPSENDAHVNPGPYTQQPVFDNEKIVPDSSSVVPEKV